MSISPTLCAVVTSRSLVPHASLIPAVSIPFPFSFHRHPSTHQISYVHFVHLSGQATTSIPHPQLASQPSNSHPIHPTHTSDSLPIPKVHITNNHSLIAPAHSLNSPLSRSHSPTDTGFQILDTSLRLISPQKHQPPTHTRPTSYFAYFPSFLWTKSEK